LRERSASASPSKFQFKIGIPLVIMAGILSSVFNFALIAGEPLEKAALAQGASDLLRMTPFILSRMGRVGDQFHLVHYPDRAKQTGSQLLGLPGETGKKLSFYYLMSLLSGAMWYFQFFFYGMGHVNMGERYGFTSWALHMAMLILFSNLYGKLFHEWDGADRLPKRVLHIGMAIIIAATLIITWGNYLGE
jgi:L-rhamnose-H+ transport protein